MVGVSDRKVASVGLTGVIALFHSIVAVYRIILVPEVFIDSLETKLSESSLVHSLQGLWMQLSDLHRDILSVGPVALTFEDQRGVRNRLQLLFGVLGRF